MQVISTLFTIWLHCLLHFSSPLLTTGQSSDIVHMGILLKCPCHHSTSFWFTMIHIYFHLISCLLFTYFHLSLLLFFALCNFPWAKDKALCFRPPHMHHENSCNITGNFVQYVHLLAILSFKLKKLSSFLSGCTTCFLSYLYVTALPHCRYRDPPRTWVRCHWCPAPWLQILTLVLEGHWTDDPGPAPEVYKRPFLLCPVSLWRGCLLLTHRWWRWIPLLLQRWCTWCCPHLRQSRYGSVDWNKIRTVGS